MLAVLRFIFSSNINRFFIVFFCLYLLWIIDFQLMIIDLQLMASEVQFTGCVMLIFFGLLFCESNADALQSNEVLRQLPGFYRRHSAVFTVFIALVLLVALSFGAYQSLRFVIVVSCWTLLACVKTYCRSDWHDSIFTLQGVALFPILLMDEVIISAYFAIPIITVAAALYFYAIWRGIEWNRDAQFRIYIDERRPLFFIADQYETLNAVKKPHALALYLSPVFEFRKLLLVGAVAFLVLHLYLDQKTGGFNTFALLFLDGYLLALLISATYGDRREVCGWYSLRPSKGNACQVQFSLLKAFSFKLSLLWLIGILTTLAYQWFDSSLSVEAVFGLLQLAFFSFLLTVGLSASFATLKVSGWGTLALLIIVGLGSGLLLLAASLAWMNTGNTPLIPAAGSLSLGAAGLLIARLRLRTIAWI